MATSKEGFKELYKDLSVEELKEKYEELKKDFCFNNADEKIDNMIKLYLNAGAKTSIGNKKIALEELVKEKSGEDLSVFPEYIPITLKDVINHITDKDKDPFWTITITNFMGKISDTSEEDKINFLIEIVQDKNLFNEFTKEILHAVNPRELFERYKIEARQYCVRNVRK